MYICEGYLHFLIIMIRCEPTCLPHQDKKMHAVCFVNALSLFVLHSTDFLTHSAAVFTAKFQANMSSIAVVLIALVATLIVQTPPTLGGFI